MSVAHESSIYT